MDIVKIQEGIHTVLTLAVRFGIEKIPVVHTVLHTIDGYKTIIGKSLMAAGILLKALSPIFPVLIPIEVGFSTGALVAGAIITEIGVIHAQDKVTRGVD